VRRLSGCAEFGVFVRIRGKERRMTVAQLSDVELQGELHLEQLKRLNAELEQRVQARTADLTSTLREREVLLQEVHHRVKNNLSAIASLIEMQTRRLPEGAGRNALQECHGRVHAIALVHEKLYRSKNYANVTFADYIRSLAGDVFQATGSSSSAISLILAVADVVMTVDKAIPCGLILNELITNALKHAFPGGRRGAVRVELARTDGGQLCLLVADDGVGLPEGFAVQEASTLGLRLIGTLARQLDAKLTVRQSHGTSFELTFPVGT
jgi:two-component sensor histidine kinase